MKAHLTENGELSINGENSIERYALQKWFDDFQNDSTKVTIGVNQDLHSDIVKDESIDSGGIMLCKEGDKDYTDPTYPMNTHIEEKYSTKGG